MKRFLIVSAVLAVTFVALSVNFLPVRCLDCDGIVLRTDVCSTLFGGHGHLVDGCRFTGPAADAPTSPGFAAGTPATAIEIEATTERPS